MRASLRLLKTPIAPFPQSGKHFDRLFKAPKREPKAWDGQDKDAFFRDKYAHVHAKQLKRRQEEAARKKRENKTVRKPEIAPIQADFASRHRERLQKTPDLEFVFGKNAVGAVLRQRNVARVYTALESLDMVDPEILSAAQQRGVPVQTRTPLQHLQIMSDFGVHNKYVAETARLSPIVAHGVDLVDGALRIVGPEEGRTSLPVLSGSRRRFPQPLGLYIDQVSDVHNMGALLRSALWFGVDFVAFSGRNCAPLNASVVKSSSGASEFVPLLETPYPLRFFDSLRNGGWQIVASGASEPALKKHGIDLAEVDANGLNESLASAPTLLVVGSEGDGIRTSLLMRSTHKTTIESSQTEIGSLNVSVAAAVLLSSLCK